MKKFLVGLSALCVLCVTVASVAAHPWGGARGYAAAAAPVTTTVVKGTLQVSGGTIALAAGDRVYYAPTLERFVGFIEGLKEGNTVTLEGYVSGDTIEPVKATIGEKVYDLALNTAGVLTLNQRTAGYGSCGGAGCGW